MLSTQKQSIRYNQINNAKPGSLHCISCFLFVILFVVALIADIPPKVVHAQSVSLPAEINKSFTPYSIVAGQTSQLSVTIFNPNVFILNNASWTDTLPVGITLADPVNLSTTCGGSVSANPGDTSILLTGGTVPAQVGATPGSCTVLVDVTSTTPGNLINTIPAGGLTSTGPSGVSITNTTPASATLQVGSVQPPSLNKNFFPNTIWAGEVSVLTINVLNNDLKTALTQVQLTDNLPAGVTLANPVNETLTNCGSADIEAVPGTGIIILNDATIAANSTCRIEVRVTSGSQGTYTNTIPAGSIQSHQGVTNAALASANLAVQSIGLTKDFAATSIPQGGSTLLTITLRNPSSVVYTGVHFTDTLPGMLKIAALPASVNNCGGTLVANADTNSIELTGGTIPASATPPTLSTCTLVVPVTIPVDAPINTLTNTIPIGNMTTDQGVSNPAAASDTLSIVRALTVTKSFSPTSITVGGSATVTVTLRNYTAAPLTNVNFTDSLPAGLTVVGTPTLSQCNGGAVSSTATSVTLTGGTIPTGTNPPTNYGSCTVVFQVTSPSSGSFNNTIPINAVTTNGGYKNGVAATTSISVSSSALPVNSSKSFNPTTIVAGSNTRLRINVVAPADTSLTNVAITDILPDGMTVSNSTPPAISNCGSSAFLNAPTNATTVSLTKGTISAGRTCQIDVYVTSSTPGTVTNTIPAGNITYNESRPLGTTPSADLTITSLSMSKEFYPPTVNPNGFSRLTITLTNNVTTRLVDVSMTDSLTTMGGTSPTSGVFIAATPNATTTCGGTLIADANTQLIKLTGGIVPARVGSVAGICTISVDVQGRGPATTRTNTIPTTNVGGTVEGSTAMIHPIAAATAKLTIGNLRIVVNKAFDPLTVFGGSAATMSIELRDPDNAPLTGITFTDNMPAGMIIANPPNFNSGTCGGVLTGSIGSSTLTYSGGELPAASSCTLSVSVTMVSNGNLTNSIPAGAVTTFNGVSNAQAANASLTNLPGASVSKYFSPSSIPAGSDQYSLLTISIRNTSSFPLTEMGVVDTLPGTLPAGLVVAGAPAPAAVNNCGGTLTAVAGSQSIQLTGGMLPGNGDCTLVVPVNGVMPGNFTNVIAPGTLTNKEGASNSLPATDTLTLSAEPALNVTKTSTYSGSVMLGTMLTYDIVVENTGNVELTNVSVTDPSAEIGICTPPQPATLATGASMTCPAAHTVVQADMNLGSYTNTATADSTETSEDSDTETVTIEQHPGLTITKAVAVSGPFGFGDTIPFSIVVKNTGDVTLTGVTVTDPGVGVTLGTCTPAQPASLLPGASLTCTASHAVTQDDVDAGSYTNTATADSDQTTPASDDETATIAQNPALSVTKTLTATGPFGLNDTLTYDIVVTNSGDVTLSGVSVTDAGTGATLGTCTPNQPAELAPDASLTCTASHAITQDDVDAGSYTNTATADSDQTTPASDDATATIAQNPAMTVTKTLTATGPFGLNDTLTYDIVVTNSGDVTLSGVSVTDVGTGATLGTCTSNQPVSLLPGASLTCSASHVVTQDDVDAGSYTNTATADSDQTTPASDDATATMAQNPALTVSKTLTATGPFGLNDTLTYAIVVTNSGDVTLTGVTVTDPGVGVTLGACNPAQPANLLPGASLTCTALHVVTQGDIETGTYTNTAVADSDQTGTDSDDETVTFTQNPAITLIKSGSLDLGTDGVATVGDLIRYTFTVTNSGNVTLTDVRISDPLSTVLGGPIASLAPGASDSTTFSGSHALTQADIDSGTFTNTASVSGKPPVGADVSATDDDTQNFLSTSVIGLSKRVVGEPVLVSAGVWDVTYELTVRNFGNVSLTNIQISDDLAKTFPASTTFSVQSLSSGDLTVNWPGYNGSSKLNLLSGDDPLAVGGVGTLRLVVRVTPAEAGPFDNSAEASGLTPKQVNMSDLSQDGNSPDPDGDGNPGNNSDPTPVDFGPDLFDPPMGIKIVDEAGTALLHWTVIWINNTNIVAVNAAASDEIPVGTTFVDNGISSGYPLPADAPAGSVASGVTCADTSAQTSTQSCYYEAPTTAYPRGRVVWQGILGPDLGARDASEAANEIQIGFNVRVADGVTDVTNTAYIDSDLNGDGDVIDGGEKQDASAATSWKRPVSDVKVLPQTGFHPGIISLLPEQPAALRYSQEDLRLEIPVLGVELPVVGVPQSGDGWDVTWLGQKAGWLNGTAYPTWSGNSVITGHVWDALNQPGPFAQLKQLSYGDTIRIHAFNQVYTYEVRENRLLSPDQTSAVFVHEEKAWVTLVTCENYDPLLDGYADRRMVRAVLVSVTQEK